jgi:hypothetical protein
MLLPLRPWRLAPHPRFVGDERTNRVSNCFDPGLPTHVARRHARTEVNANDRDLLPMLPFGAYEATPVSERCCHLVQVRHGNELPIVRFAGEPSQQRRVRSFPERDNVQINERIRDSLSGRLCIVRVHIVLAVAQKEDAPPRALRAPATHVQCQPKGGRDVCSSSAHPSGQRCDPCNQFISPWLRRKADREGLLVEPDHSDQVSTEPPWPIGPSYQWSRALIGLPTIGWNRSDPEEL